MFSENWLKIFVNRIKQKYINLHIKKMWQANLTVASTYLLTLFWKVKTENSVRNSDFLIDPLVEIIGVNWAKVIMHPSYI